MRMSRTKATSSVDEIEPGTPFRPDPDRALFILSEAGFYSPPDWQLTCLIDPRIWFNVMLAARHPALEPVLPAA